MNILLRQATIIDPSSPFHLQKADILIANSIFQQIESTITTQADYVIDLNGSFISPGWVETFTDACDPGFEYKETIESATLAAAHGGFTDLMILPNTLPVVHTKAGVEYLVQKGKQSPVHIHPIAAVTKNIEGKELAEMYDMAGSGAVAFSDGSKSIQDAGLLLKALQYVKAIDKTIIQLPEDKSFNPHGLMNEGIISTQLGLPGKPAIAEELMVARDIELVKYTGSKLHFTGISSKKSVELIKQAKAENLSVTCSVTPYHLCFIDEDLSSYDTNLKVNPPLRTAADRKALQEAVLDGTIDCIAVHHIPEDIDHKITEFEYARYGMIGLQTAFAVVQKTMPQLAPEKLVSLFAIQPRNIFGLESASIQIGSTACCSLFSLDQEWAFEKDKNQSKSSNSPFFDNRFNAKPLGIINKGNLILNN
ncbi:dihydroorotase [Flavisolibacter tropicus]|uniref:Dihydroorotase n=1 Tax=Flavisolibacter tropicus TaxID=1492898 RepID=A0A172TQW1_9BACT|nr:dihydroorotase [Flavisolibacter tropicus]ANE49376.1 dihydroorotase [Flavisolibacter tropicus]